MTTKTPQERWEKDFRQWHVDNNYTADTEYLIYQITKILTTTEEKIIRKQTKDLKAILSEKNVTDEWRISEIEAIISLNERALKALTPTDNNK